MNARGAFRATAAAAALLLASCAGSPYRWSPTAEAAALLAGPRPGYPAARFAVISDPHLYYAAALGAEGEAFAEEIAYDRKMVVESADIIGEALRRVRSSGVQFLLVPGDLTQEGERVNHERFASLLADVERSGVPVYVLPGNHDILNPDAAAFGVGGRRPVPGVTPGSSPRSTASSGTAKPSAATRDRSRTWPNPWRDSGCWVSTRAATPRTSPAAVR